MLKTHGKRWVVYETFDILQLITIYIYTVNMSYYVAFGTQPLELPSSYIVKRWGREGKNGTTTKSMGINTKGLTNDLGDLGVSPF